MEILIDRIVDFLHKRVKNRSWLWLPIIVLGVLSVVVSLMEIMNFIGS